jgi:hypothetical protein
MAVERQRYRARVQPSNIRMRAGLHGIGGECGSARDEERRLSPGERIGNRDTMLPGSGSAPISGAIAAT